MNPSPPLSYWLLSGETPTGPFPANDILAQIQQGSCTWTTRACPVGGSTWLPLNQLLQLAPIAQRIEDAAPEQTISSITTPAPIKASASANTPAYHYRLVVIAIVVGLVGFWLYSSFFATSPTPLQVCHAFAKSTSIQEARKHVTPAMHPALEVLYSQQEAMEDEGIELSTEQAVPANLGGGYYVAFRARARDAMGLTIMNGVLHVVSHSGWKVNDMILMELNDQVIQPPISMAREHALFRNPQLTYSGVRHNTESTNHAQQWHRSQVNHLTTAGSIALGKSSVGKWLGGVWHSVPVPSLG
ncbi:MAG: hypothetical protein U0796_02335 [Gemmatales bacterium]